LGESLASDISQLNTIKLGISLLFKPGQLVEFRIKNTEGYWKGLYFSDHEQLAQTVERLDADPRVVSLYYVINPVKPNFVRERQKAGDSVVENPNAEQVEEILSGPSRELTKNEDIDTLQWLFIDIDTTRSPELAGDPERKKEFDAVQHECSTDAEKAATKVVATNILQDLDARGWPQPLLGDSGNGFHILCKLNMGNNQHNIHMLVDCLKALAAKHNCAVADIDCAVFNASRLTRAYGTTTRKGTNTPERPFRRNRLLPPKAPILAVTLDQILQLGSAVPVTNRRSDDVPELVEGFDPNDWIEWYENQGAFATDGTRETNGMTIVVTDTCLVAGHKHTGSSLSGFVIGDTFGYHCFSDDCEGSTIGTIFKILREAVDEKGNPLYKPYPYPVFVDEGLDAVAEFAEEAKDAEARIEAGITAEIEEELTVKAEPEPGEEPTPDSRKPDDADKFCDERTHDLLAIMLHHPEDTYIDGFIHYKKRIKDKLGMNNPPSKRKPPRGEVSEVTISVPFGPTLMTLIKYVDAHKKLPDKEALKNFILINDDLKKDKVLSQFKDEMVKYIDSLTEQPASKFDETATQLLKVLDVRFEIRALRAAIPILKEDWNIQEFRSALRRNQNKSTAQDSNFSQGAWQEKTEEIYDRFARKLSGVDDSRKFKTFFPTIDNSGANIGLDGSRYICFCGPSNNRKTTAVMSLGLNYAIQGKNGIFFAGEHQVDKVLDKLTLQLSHFYREDPEIGPIPGSHAWDGLTVTATEEDLAKIKTLKLKAGEIVPGYLEPQNIGVIAGGEENKIEALLAYAESTYAKYQWDFIIIDPVDSIMPSVDAHGRALTYDLRAEAIERLFQFSRHAFGGKGCMVIITAQFGSSAVRDIQKIQEKNGGVERFDDEIESILRRDGNIHSLTTIIEKCDLCIGVATLTKNGNDGLMVRGRDRNAGREWVLEFSVDPDSNYMTEKKRPFAVVSAEDACEKSMAASFDEEL
jgi:hypothetical protein